MRSLKKAFLVLTIVSLLFLVSCDLLLQDDFFGDSLGDDSYDDVEEHICSFGEWTVAEEASCSEPGEAERECSICGEIETKEITALPHAVVVDSAVEPTENTPGMTEGKHCAVCGTIIIKQEYIYSDDYTNPSKYSGDYAYNYLGNNYQKGASMQSFYRHLDSVVETFHSTSEDAKIKTVSGKEIYFAAEIEFSQFGLADEEAVAVWSAYKFDHPLYYWISNRVTYGTEKMSLVVYDEYADGDTRIEYNSKIYDKVRAFIANLEGKGDTYQLVLSFHDGIILSADYAYEDDGVTPEDAAYAHNILGVMLLGEGVCESYTKAFQLLLNYCGIENIYVSGYAGEPHAWNLVEMSDGEWYWFDLTWDDTPKRGLGVRYSYFCVNDTDNVKIFDGSADEFGTFTNDHTPSIPVDFGSEFVYSIPSRSVETYAYDGVMLRDDVIVLDGLSYVICGSDACALVNIAAEGDVVIPETITIDGSEYRVEMIGKFENGRIGSGSVIPVAQGTYQTPKINSITIPKTVKVIWDYAFINAKTVKNYYIDVQNSVYSSLNGVLFTKNLYTLIQYPLASSSQVYVTPDETVEIAFGAFGDGGNVFCPANLKNLTLGENIEVVGAGHFGTGYRDDIPSDEGEIIIVEGYFERLQKIFGNGLKK